MKRISIRTARQQSPVSLLVDYLRRHDGVEVHGSTDTTITVSTVEVVNGVAGRSAPEDIPATRDRVREWLGY